MRVLDCSSRVSLLAKRLVLAVLMVALAGCRVTGQYSNALGMGDGGHGPMVLS